MTILFARRVRRGVGAVSIAATLTLGSVTAFAGVTSTTTNRYYSVSGTTQPSLARTMRGNPFRGDGGGAIANIRPKYSLKVNTQELGNTCKVTNVDLNIHFILTLPRAQESAMSAATLTAWRSFVSFARRHEQQHRTIYLQCARNFVVKAQRLSSTSCAPLRANAQRLLESENRDCDKRHAAFDRSEKRRLISEPLFRTAQR